MADRIVAGVGGNDTEVRAIAWAAQRALATGVELEIVHVVDDDWGTDALDLTADAVAEAEKRIHDIADRLRADHEGLSVHAAVIVGSPVYELCDHASDAALLVVGSRSAAHGAGRRAGVRASRMAEYATVSVVIVPDVPTDGHGVVVGVDGSELSAAAVRFAAAEADRASETLTAVRAWQPPWFWGAESGQWPISPSTDDELALAESLAGIAEDHPDLRVERVLTPMRPADALIDAAKGASMLVVGSHGRGALGRAWFGSVSEEVVLAMPCTVAVIR